jgi:hypothetical protein
VIAYGTQPEIASLSTASEAGGPGTERPPAARVDSDGILMDNYRPRISRRSKNDGPLSGFAKPCSVKAMLRKSHAA